MCNCEKKWAYKVQKWQDSLITMCFDHGGYPTHKLWFDKNGSGFHAKFTVYNESLL